MSMDTSLLDHEGSVEYYTHDNGARPFKVVVTLNNKITIIQNRQNNIIKFIIILSFINICFNIFICFK